MGSLTPWAGYIRACGGSWLVQYGATSNCGKVWYMYSLHLGFNHKGLEYKIHITFLSPFDKKAETTNHIGKAHPFFSGQKGGSCWSHHHQPPTTYSCIHSFLTSIYHYYIKTAVKSPPVQQKQQILCTSLFYAHNPNTPSYRTTNTSNDSYS